MKIINKLKTKTFYLLFIMIFVQFTYCNTIKKAKSTGITNIALNKLKAYYEGKYQILEASQKKCWDYLWDEGMKNNPGLMATLKLIAKSFYEILRGNYSREKLNNDLLSIFRSVGDQVIIDGNTLACKSLLNTIVSQDDNKDKKIVSEKPQDTKPDPNLNAKPPGFITSAASVHRDASFRNPDLFKTLNAQ